MRCFNGWKQNLGKTREPIKKHPGANPGVFLFFEIGHPLMAAFEASARVFGVMARQFVADDIFHIRATLSAMIDRIGILLGMMVGMAGRMQMQEYIGGLFAVLVFHIETPGKTEQF